MKTPPLLAGAALVFWGWQTGFLVVGILMALVLEGARWIKARWEFSDDDFKRIWTICTVLLLGATVFAFTNNAGPARLGNYFQNPNPSTQNGASLATSKMASSILRWLPMALFPFVAAQVYSTRELIPLAAISLIVRRRRKQALMRGEPLPEGHDFNVSFPYFAVCLFAASVHAGENNNYYFWGLCALITWALWARRTRRFGIIVWGCALGLALVLGYFGQSGISQLQSYLQNIDPQWLTQWLHHRSTDPTQSRTSLGQLGQLKSSGRIIIRLQTKDGAPPPGYLHEASYQVFKWNSWSVGTLLDMFENISEVPQNSGNWPLMRSKTNTDQVAISCYLDDDSQENAGARAGLLPLPNGSCRVDNLFAISIKLNRLGAVLAEGPRLVSFNACYGPGATIDAPFNPREMITNAFPERLNGEPVQNLKSTKTNEFVVPFNPDAYVPLVEKPALDSVISDFHLYRTNYEATLRAVNGYFENNFTYSTWQDRPRRNDLKQTPLTRFLLTTHKGHCEYFATATVLLLREMGIPARYAVGYGVHEKSGDGYVVRLRDGHAWSQVWNERTKTWEIFDTTPASWVEEDSRDASMFQGVYDLWSWLQFQFSRFLSGQTNLRKYLLFTLTPVLILLLAQVFLRRRRRRNLQEEGAGSPVIWPGADSEFYLVERKLADRGIPRLPNEPLSAWLARAMADPALDKVREPLRALLRLHYSYRFDPRGLEFTDREELKRNAELALAELSKN